MDHDARELYRGFYIGGVEYKRDLYHTYTGMFVSHAFMVDLKPEIDALINAGYTLRDTPFGAEALY